MPKIDSKGKRLEASKFTYGDKDFKDYKDFEATYRPYAEAAVQKKISEGKKIPVEVLLSQAYIESSGGRNPLNNNISGLKASKSETNYGLYETTEFHKEEDHYKKFEKDGKYYADTVAFPPRKPGEYREIKSTELVEDKNSPNYGKYRYRVDAYFSHSNNVQEGFEKVIDNFYVTPQYRTAITNDDALNNPEIFLKSISGNYATEGGYYDIVSPYLNVSMETTKKMEEERVAIENKTKLQQQVQDSVDKVMPEFVKNSVNRKPLAQDKVPFAMFAPKMKKGGVSISGNVNAEGKELILKNNFGDYAIIPKNHRAEVLDMVKEGCNNCIDNYVSNLPKMHNYAKDGTLIPNPDDYESFNKFRKTLPPNLRNTKYEYGNPDNEYDLYGYWESFNKPKTFGTMLFNNPEYKRSDDGMYHGISRNPKTGQLLKSPSHKTFDLGVNADRDLGYQTYIGKDGKYYSHKVGEINWKNFEKPYVKAANGLVIGGGDGAKIGAAAKPANTSNAKSSTIQQVNPNINTSLIGKTWDDIPANNPANNQPQLKQDNRTDYEREQDQKAMESYLNPSFIEQAWSGARMVSRAIADPIQGIGQIFDAVGLGDTRIGQDLGNFNDEEAAYRYRNVNPNMSAGEKFMGNLSEGSEVAAWGATNFIPFESSVINPIVKRLVGKGNYSSYVANQLYSPVVNKGVKEVVKSSVVNQVDDVVKNSKQWQLEELPGLHIKSTMENNQQGLHKYISKDGSINTKSAMEHIKRMEGDAKYEVVLQNMQNRYGANLENMPKRMDYNTLRKEIQDDLWDIGTGKGQQVDKYANMDMKSFGIIKNDIPISPQHKPTSLGYDADEVVIGGYSFTNKNKFIGGSDAHSMPKETLGHVRSFTNPKEHGVYYSVERQSNWAQEAGSTLKKTDIELLQRQQKKLPELIKEQDDLIAAGNDTWAIGQKERFQNQLKEVNAKIDSYNRYANASPQEKLVMKNMNERMLQEDVAYAASQGHTKYRLPSEETMAKIQGFKKKTKIDDALLSGKEADELITLKNKYNKMPDNVTDADWDNIYDPIRKRMDELNKKKIVELGYEDGSQTILKHTSQSLKDAEKLFDVKLKPITDSKGNIWYEFDIPKKFIDGKGEIKAFSTIPVGVGTAGTIGSAQQKNNNTNSQ